jgi:hypothetical protein
MTTFSNSPRLIKGGLVLIDQGTSAVVRIIVLQYNPDTLTRTLQAQGAGAEVERRGLLPPMPPKMRTPHRGSEDRRRGCSYEILPDMRLNPTAPARTPRQIP